MKNKIPGWMRTLIPGYTVLPLICALVLQTITYSGTRLLTAEADHHNFETALDLATPLLPWTVAIYVGAFLYWIIGIALILRSGKDHAFRFLCTHILGMLIAMAFFLFLPTTCTRPQVTGGGPWNWILRLIYAADTPDNLFPSLHCQLSWLCYLALKEAPNVSPNGKRFCCVFSLLVFVSTLTTKQHILIDVLGGWLIAELTFRLCGSRKITAVFYKVFDR